VLVVVDTGMEDMTMDEEGGAMALSGSPPAAKRPRATGPLQLALPPRTGELRRPLMASSPTAPPQASSLNDIRTHDHFLAGGPAVVGPVGRSNFEKKHTSMAFDLCYPHGLLNGDARRSLILHGHSRHTAHGLSWIQIPIKCLLYQVHGIP
jgi:hypothetical protein